MSIQACAKCRLYIIAYTTTTANVKSHKALIIHSEARSLYWEVRIVWWGKCICHLHDDLKTSASKGKFKLYVYHIHQIY